MTQRADWVPLNDCLSSLVPGGLYVLWVGKEDCVNPLRCLGTYRGDGEFSWVHSLVRAVYRPDLGPISEPAEVLKEMSK